MEHCTSLFPFHCLFLASYKSFISFPGPVFFPFPQLGQLSNVF